MLRRPEDASSERGGLLSSDISGGPEATMTSTENPAASPINLEDGTNDQLWNTASRLPTRVPTVDALDDVETEDPRTSHDASMEAAETNGTFEPEPEPEPEPAAGLEMEPEPEPEWDESLPVLFGWSSDDDDDAGSSLSDSRSTGDTQTPVPVPSAGERDISMDCHVTSSTRHSSCHKALHYVAGCWESNGSRGSHYVQLQAPKGKTITLVELQVGGYGGGYDPCRVEVQTAEPGESIERSGRTSVEVTGGDGSMVDEVVHLFSTKLSSKPVRTVRVNIRESGASEGGINCKVGGLKVYGTGPELEIEREDEDEDEEEDMSMSRSPMSRSLSRGISLNKNEFKGEEFTEMYHGTDSRTARRIVCSQRFRPSHNGLLVSQPTLRLVHLSGICMTYDRPDTTP